MILYKIPETLVIGFKMRNDTYNGKLSFITCYTSDRTNKHLLKEDAWERWCDSDIPTEIYENTLQEGYVFNKNVTHHGEMTRFERFRVYDPRGFEFEITPDNMNIILESSDIIKGVIVERCIFAFDGVNRFLLPETSREYKSTVKTINTKVKINRKDMVIGQGYKFTYAGNSTKELNKDVVHYYMGYHYVPYTKLEYGKKELHIKTVGSHVFYSTKTLDIVVMKGLSYIQSVVDGDMNHDLPFERLEREYTTPISRIIVNGIELKEIDVSKQEKAGTYVIYYDHLALTTYDRHRFSDNITAYRGEHEVERVWYWDWKI